MPHSRQPKVLQLVTCKTQRTHPTHKTRLRILVSVESSCAVIICWLKQTDFLLLGQYFHCLLLFIYLQILYSVICENHFKWPNVQQFKWIYNKKRESLSSIGHRSHKKKSITDFYLARSKLILNGSILSKQLYLNEDNSF